MAQADDQTILWSGGRHIYLCFGVTSTNRLMKVELGDTAAVIAWKTPVTTAGHQDKINPTMTFVGPTVVNINDQAQQRVVPYHLF